MEEILNEESIGQFSIKAFIKELKKGILFIVAVTLFFTALGGVIGRFFVKTKYTSTATMIIRVLDQNKTITLADAEKLATSTTSYLSPRTDIIYQIVETTFNASGPKQKVSIKELKESLTVSVDSVMINLEYTSTNVAAKSLLNSIMDQLQSHIQGEPFYGCELTILSPASDVSDDHIVKVFKLMAIFFVLGGALSVLAIFLAVLLRDTYNDREFLETDVGIDVLAEIEYCPLQERKEVE